jgi:hypothetical protein
LTEEPRTGMTDPILFGDGRRTGVALEMASTEYLRLLQKGSQLNSYIDDQNDTLLHNVRSLVGERNFPVYARIRKVGLLASRA